MGRHTQPPGDLDDDPHTRRAHRRRPHDPAHPRRVRDGRRRARLRVVRIAHCPDHSSPYNAPGYTLREIGWWDDRPGWRDVPVILPPVR